MVDAALKAKLKKKYGDEQVLVSPYKSCLSIKDKFADTLWEELKIFSNSQFVLRCDAEYNVALIQPIPYILVMNKAMNKVYVTERIAGEERLRGTLALGAGGHINPVDFGPDIHSIFENAAIRELNEELDITLIKDTSLEYIGTVRDLESRTLEHLGIVYIAKARTVKVKEKDTLKGLWMDFPALFRNYSKFESWARHIIDHMLLSGSSRERIKFKKGG